MYHRTVASLPFFPLGLFFILCVSVLSACVCDTFGGQRRASALLELELQMAVDCHVGSGIELHMAVDCCVGVGMELQMAVDCRVGAGNETGSFVVFQVCLFVF